MRRRRPFMQQPTGSPSAQGSSPTSQPLPPALSTGGLDNCAGSARLRNWLGRDQLRSFVADVADRLRHRMRAQYGVQAGGKELAEPRRCGVAAQPRAVIPGLVLRRSLDALEIEDEHGALYRVVLADGAVWAVR